MGNSSHRLHRCHRRPVVGKSVLLICGALARPDWQQTIITPVLTDGQSNISPTRDLPASKRVGKGFAAKDDAKFEEHLSNQRCLSSCLFGGGPKACRTRASKGRIKLQEESKDENDGIS